jgi:hypothetical protein
MQEGKKILIPKRNEKINMSPSDMTHPRSIMQAEEENE